MKRNVQTGLTVTAILKAVSTAFNSLFFSEDREFQRLKNFIAS